MFLEKYVYFQNNKLKHHNALAILRQKRKAKNIWKIEIL